jgi:hypothetical protein
MIKIVFITIGVIALATLLGFAIFFTKLLLIARKQPPSYGLIEQKYYVCRKHKLLEGGIFGKGLTLKFSQNNKQQWCWRNEWEEIDRESFKRLATEWYGKDWSEEQNFWKD